MNTLYIPISGSSTDISGTITLPNATGSAPLIVTYDYTDELFEQQSATVVKTILKSGVSVLKKSAAVGNHTFERNTYTTLTNDISKTACTTNTVIYNAPGIYNVTLEVTYGDWKRVTYVMQLTIGNTTLSYKADNVSITDDGSVVVSFTDEAQRANSLCVLKI